MGTLPSGVVAGVAGVAGEVSERVALFTIAPATFREALKIVLYLEEYWGSLYEILKTRHQILILPFLMTWTSRVSSEPDGPP